MAKTPAQTSTDPQRTALAEAAGAVARHAFKGLQDWVEVFRAGTHTDSKGRTATFTQGDLDEMAANVAGSGAPAVLGHPKPDAPAYAWVKPGAMKRDGDSLLAQFSDINPDFEAGVDSGAYRERSVAVFKDKARGWVVQHVGWLGAAAPAITGLAPLTYSANVPAEAEVHEFASMDAGYALSDVAALMRGLRDWIISKDGLDVANQVLSDWAITSISDVATRIKDEARTALGLQSAFTRATNPGDGPNGDRDMPQFTQADIDAAADKARKDTAEAEALKFSAQAKELSELRAERQQERIGLQINGWKAAGLLLPAEEHGAAEFMASLEGGDAAEFQFTAADKTEAKKTPAQWFAEFVGKRKALVKLGVTAVVADPNAVPALDTNDFNAVATAAREFITKEAAAGRQVGAAQAVQHVTAAAEAAAAAGA